MIYYPPASLRAGSDTEGTELGFYQVFSVISVPPWLIFVLIGQTYRLV
jgi:hypothetical protein